MVMSPRIAYVRADGMPTSSPTMSVEGPGSASGTYAMGSMPVTDGPPPDVVYGGPGGAGGGCNCGGGSPDGSDTCRSCSGWQHGTCNTQDPNGSCVLQRLACCLSKPYPDCSNGCIDFCHSWIFHEDDCWLFSNHKCPGPGCGPFPYGSCPNDGQGKGNGCGCGCGDGPCVPAPDVYFTVGALVLTRDNAVRPQILVQNTTTGDNLLSTKDLDFDWFAGPSFVLGYRPTKMDAWELTYFGLQDFNSVRSVFGAADLTVPGTLGTLGNFGPVGANPAPSVITVDYNSQIDDAELNYYWHHDCENLMWMAGFRYFQLDEKFDLASTVTGVGTSVYDIRTTNNMAGGQVGVRLKTECSFLEWDITGKAGAFGNSVGQAQTVFNTDGSAIGRGSAGDHQGVWAFVGDLGSNVNVNLCRNWSVMGGYNLMWVDGVALAPNQIDLIGTGAGLDRKDHVFYQGAHLALGCRW
jgi:hypothetical protein